jgi:hypothetical protein
MRFHLLSAPIVASLLVPSTLVLVTGCVGAKLDDSDSVAAADSDSGTPDVGVSPTIVSVDTVQCAEYQSAGENWDIALTVDDPQGAETVKDGTITVLNADGGELASYALACGNGLCVGSFRAEYDGIGCSLVGEVTLRFVVIDAESNASAPTNYAT